MPELPEVETVRRQLAEEIVGEEIVGVEVRRESCYVGSRELGGEVVKEVRRVGKYLFVYFESMRGLAVHLKMTGRLIINKQTQQLNNTATQQRSNEEFDYETAAHTRVVIRFMSGRNLYFWDMRTFGYVRVEEEIKRAEEKVKSKLGKDPWEMTEKGLVGKLKKTGRSIKDAILDQSLIAGVGNIYANDGLHLAGILPQRIASKLSEKEVGKLLSSLRTVMELGLATNGASDNSYVDAYGQKGAYQNEFRVYGKTKGECLVCKQKLEYGKVGGRGTWWCVRCQK